MHETGNTVKFHKKIRRHSYNITEDKDHLLYEPGRVILCVGNLMREVLCKYDWINQVCSKQNLVTFRLWCNGPSHGRTIAQAVSRWLPTSAARVRARLGHVGFVVDRVALGHVFSEYFGFPCQYLFHQLLLHNHHNLSSGAGTIGK
jgi:hypothetical protein